MVTRVEPEKYLSRLGETRLSPEARAYTALKEEGTVPKYFPASAYTQYPGQLLEIEPSQANYNLLGIVAVVGIVAIAAMFMYRRR